MELSAVADSYEPVSKELEFLNPPAGEYQISYIPHQGLQRLKSEKFRVSVRHITVSCNKFGPKETFTALGRELDVSELVQMSQAAINIKEVKLYEGKVYQLIITTNNGSATSRYSLGLLEDGNTWGLKSKAKYRTSPAMNNAFTTLKGVCIRPLAIPAALRLTSFVDLKTVHNQQLDTKTMSCGKHAPSQAGSDTCFIAMTDIQATCRSPKRKRGFEHKPNVTVIELQDEEEPSRTQVTKRSRRCRRAVDYREQSVSTASLDGDDSDNGDSDEDGDEDSLGDGEGESEDDSQGDSEGDRESDSRSESERNDDSDGDRLQG